MRGLPPASPLLAELTWAGTIRSLPIVDGMDSPCWLRRPAGYKSDINRASIRCDGVQVLASRAALILVGAEVAPGLCTCHICDVATCVNPAHLFLGTNAHNAADRGRKGRDPRNARSREEGRTAAVRIVTCALVALHGHDARAWPTWSTEEWESRIATTVRAHQADRAVLS